MTQPTMSEARRYQQLRAHLCYLKLNDAAEVLPRIPGEARAERLTLTTALVKVEQVIAHGNFSCSPHLPHAGRRPGSHRRTTSFLALVWAPAQVRTGPNGGP